MSLKIQLNSSGRRVLLALVFAFGLIGAIAAQAGAAIYWVNGDSIGRMNLDGTNPSPGLVFDYRNPIFGGCGLAVDGSHLYWAARGGNVIGRSSLEGQDREYAFITGANAPCGVAVDDTHIYWANRGGDSIGRARLDGTQVEQEFIPAIDNPCGVSLDGDFIYWAGWTEPGYVGRALLEGGARAPNLIELEPSAGYSLCGVAAHEGHVFFGGFGDAIGRVGADGSDPEARFITGVQSPCAIAIGGGQLYWSEVTTLSGLLGHVSRSNLDGTGMDREIVSGLNYPCGIAVDSLSFGPAYVAAPPVHFWTPCSIEELRINRSNGSALVRLDAPVHGDFRVTSRGLHWRVLSKPHPGQRSPTWRAWIRIRPAAKGRAAYRLRTRLARTGRASVKLQIRCSEAGYLTSNKAKWLVLHQQVDRSATDRSSAGPPG
jgi:virginiamycin B lyase